MYRGFLSLKGSNGNDAKVGETDDESSSDDAEVSVKVPIGSVCPAATES
jgi:hypothetical protein